MGLFTFLGVLTLTILVDGQNQLGFISLDCGISANSNYTDEKTTLNYVSDASFINAGVGKAIAPGYSATLPRQLLYVRTFPRGERNCYNIPVTITTKYLIRTTFYYGDYDGLNEQPTFDLHLGVNKWVSVDTVNVTGTLTEEIIYTAPMNYIHVCLVNTGKGTPFLSALELRPLPNNTYDVPAGALALFLRLDVGSKSSDSVRYPHDAYDRIWYPAEPFDQWTDITTNLTIDAHAHKDYQPPSIVMRSASTPTDASQPMKFYIEPADSMLEFYIFMHFAEIEMLGPNQTRIFNISDQNNETWYGLVNPDYLSTTTISSKHSLKGDRGQYLFSLDKVDGSTLPPILNADEYYYIVNLDLPQTEQADVDAITNIKSTYGITRNWQGDPCAPQNYSWDGLNCSYPDGAQPIITALNLSSSGLVGLISPDIGNLQSLESLDLSNNSFTGSVPSFLSNLTSLKVLNLSGNNLTRSVPGDLCQRSQNGLLQLSVSGDPYLSPLESCTPTKVGKKKKTSTVAPVVASIAGVLVLVTALATVFICLRRRKKSGANVDITSSRSHEPLDAKKRQFTYSEIRQMTNNFIKVLGKGGFGTVYHGYLGGTPVAVKMLSESSIQGFKEFQAEVKLLLRVHHKNLTTLVGYCDEGPNLGLIYEYMANGNLKDHLSEKNSYTLIWEGRLQVAVEAAQGLEYLHNGCKPPIVHRDVKTANIILNDKFQAKLADFGLSRVFQTGSGTSVSTTFAGTPGYLDPECYLTNRLMEKSDVFSFGVVLLEIITGRSVIDRAKQYGHISQWVSSLVEKGDINQVADPRLHGEFDINSVWKVVELALSCLSIPSERRPTMSQVVIELNEALAMEMARTREGFITRSKKSIDTIHIHSTISPAAR